MVEVCGFVAGVAGFQSQFCMCAWEAGVVIMETQPDEGWQTWVISYIMFTTSVKYYYTLQNMIGGIVYRDEEKQICPEKSYSLKL